MSSGKETELSVELHTSKRDGEDHEHKLLSKEGWDKYATYGRDGGVGAFSQL